MEWPQRKTKRASSRIRPSESANGDAHARGSPPTTADWDRHKERIYDLYINQKKKLQHVVPTMRDEHDFFATPRMYKKRLSECGYRKYTTRKVYKNSAEEWQCNEETFASSDEEFGECPAPLGKIRRPLKRKKADGGQNEYACPAQGARKRARPTVRLLRKETTNRHLASTAHEDADGSEDVLGLPEHAHFILNDDSTAQIPFNSEGYHGPNSRSINGENHTVVQDTQNTKRDDFLVPAILEGGFLMADLCSLTRNNQKICNAEAWILICFLSAAYQGSGLTLQATMGYEKLPGLFRSMAAEPNVHMLPAIVIVAVIMEAYGYEYLASQVLQHACAVCDAYFGPADDITLTIKFIVNMLDKEKRQFNLQPRDLEDVMCNMFHKFGESHPYFLVTLYNLARAYDIAGQPRKAAERLRRLDLLCQSKLARGHGLSIICQMSLARIDAQEGHTAAAVDLIKLAISQCKHSWGENHPYTLECVRRLAMLSPSVGATEQSIERLLRQVLQGRRERLGPKHRYTIGSEMQLVQWRSEHGW